MLEKGNRTIIALLNNAAESFANKHYLSYKTDEGWISYTYKEVRDNSRAIAVSLLKFGIKKEDKLTIVSEGSPMWVTAEHGILFAGAISVPLSVKLLPEELPYRFNHAEAKAIFTSKNHLTKIIQIDSLIENREMYIIYFDKDIDYFFKELEKAGIPKERGLSYWKLLDEGHDLLKNAPTLLDPIIKLIKEDDVVNISYTSGTTGNPKGIMLTHVNYYVNALDGITVFKLKKGFRSLIILPIDHCFAHTVAIYGALFSALDLYFIDTRGGLFNTLKNIPINLKEIKPEFLLTVPALSGNFINKMKAGVEEKGNLINGLFKSGLNAGNKIYGDTYHPTSIMDKVLNYIPYKIASSLIFSKLSDVFGGKLNYMVGGGALLDIKQQQFYFSIGSPVYQGYGLTEAAPIISSNTPFVHKLGTSGKIMPNVECKIMKNDTTMTTGNEIGEIVIRGENVMKGYFKNEEATKECLKNGWLWTGDLGYIDEDGFLLVTGRNKALLISDDAEKYSPERIEEAIVNSSDFIGQAMLYNDHSKFTSAVVTLDPLKLKKFKNKPPKYIVSAIKIDLDKFKSEPVYQGQFPEKWTPRAMFIAPEPFSEENKMINSTLKMVRHKVAEHYKNEIETIYKDPDELESINNFSVLQILKNKD
jgi:long-chain acyl-CoA synthetase